MKRFRVGVIGVGFIGAVHIEQLRRLGNVDVVAVAVHSRPQDKADKLCVPKGYSDYREMIDKENLDCVHICTPNNTHYEMAMYALEHGVNVVCEKPMTTTVEEAAKRAASTPSTAAISRTGSITTPITAGGWSPRPAESPAPLRTSAPIG